jgi:hypothetical protein
MKKHVYVPVLKALIYGNAGAGKTTLASSVLDHPDMSPVFYLNAAGNPVSLFAARGPYEHVFDIERMEDLSNVYSFLRTKQRREDTRKALGLKDGETFKTIVIDTISEVQQMQIKMLKNWDGDIGTAVKMSPQDWGEVLQHITNLAGMFYRLPNINVVMVAQEKEIEDKMLKLLKYSISLQGQAVNTVAAHANQVFRLSISGVGHVVARIIIQISRIPIHHRTVAIADPTALQVRQGTARSEDQISLRPVHSGVQRGFQGCVVSQRGVAGLGVRIGLIEDHNVRA